MTNNWAFFIFAVTQQIVLGQQVLDSYLGCAWDARHRDMKQHYRRRHTIASCRKAAAKGKFKYFGLQVGHECYAGNTYGSKGYPGADAYCFGGKKPNEPSRERMQQHGSNWINAVYTTKEQWFTLKKDKSMRRKGTFVGCYWDDSSRQLRDKFKVGKKKKKLTTVSSVEECGKLAVANKMKTFSMQVGTECMMSKKLLARHQRYPATFAIRTCAKSKPKKASKKWGNFGGSNWVNAIYYAKPSLYYPAAYWDAIGGDDTIRPAWASSYCLDVHSAKYKKGQAIVLYHCVDADGKGTVRHNRQFLVTGGKIKCKASPTFCITLPKAKAVGKVPLVLDKCGAKNVVQDIDLFDDMTIRFRKALAIGFNVHGGISGGDGIKGRKLYSYKVDASNNENWLIRASAPPTPKPTPRPTPAPPLSRLKKAKGWAVVKGYQKGKGCTIDISSGVPCAVSPNYPKKYSSENSCLVKMKKTAAVKVDKFITEKYFDTVSIGSIKMDGAMKKKRTIVLPKRVDSIKWISDFYLEGQGWKICKTKKPSLKLPGPKKKKKKKGGKRSR